MASATLNLDTEQLKAVAEILAGAAWADNQYHGLEAETISKIIAEHADNEEASARAHAHLDAFDRDAFDIEDACGRASLETNDEIAALLGLVARVTDADFTHDFAETDYILTVAKALGADEATYKLHTVEEIKVAFSLPKPS